MPRYHANPRSGKVAVCRAKNGACPFGESLHGNSENEASFAYDAHVRGDTDPETNPFASFSKRPPRVARAQANAKARETGWARLLDKTRKTFVERGMSVSIAGGILAAAAFGGGMAHHHASQDFEPVQTAVASSTVTSQTQWRKVGSTRTPHKVYTTKVEAKAPDGETVKVEYSGEKDFQEGDALVMYRVEDGSYKTAKPGSMEQYGKDAALGGMVGGGVLLAGLGASFLAVTADDKRRRRQRLYGKAFAS